MMVALGAGVERLPSQRRGAAAPHMAAVIRVRGKRVASVVQQTKTKVPEGWYYNSCRNLMAMLPEQQVQGKLLQYEAFVSDVLQRDLQKVLEQREEVCEKIAQYLQLKNVIERLQETRGQELVTQVDLGCNFYVNAEVPETSTIFVALGYGFYAELTLPEALVFIEKKNKLLTEANLYYRHDLDYHHSLSAGSARPSPKTLPRSKPISGWF
ncbi:protein UXT isoform X2 [Hemicordylus capensis]|uniref:protein UXT isoform X2 n=1 Tax=Hemicordylus capensis TaxID=884348 RepID=UPI00230334E2|nr:protein UXT isoform X2 [Hemicordylus capensis]